MSPFKGAHSCLISQQAFCTSNGNVVVGWSSHTCVLQAIKQAVKMSEDSKSSRIDPKQAAKGKIDYAKARSSPKLSYTIQRKEVFLQGCISFYQPWQPEYSMLVRQHAILVPARRRESLSQEESSFNGLAVVHRLVELRLLLGEGEKLGSRATKRSWSPGVGVFCSGRTAES